MLTSPWVLVLHRAKWERDISQLPYSDVRRMCSKAVGAGTLLFMGQICLSARFSMACKLNLVFISFNVWGGKRI